MKDGIYEQLLNNELKSKLNESEFFYKTNTILKSPENAKNLITEYLKEVTRKAMDCIQENNVDLEYLYAFTHDKVGKAILLLHSDDLEGLISALQKNNVPIVPSKEVYNL